MTSDDPLAIQLLRRREVVLLRIDKVPRLQVSDRHRYGEFSVGADTGPIRREYELGRWHILGGWNCTQWRRVTRAVGDLSTVCEGKANSFAKVDEIVRGRQ